MHRLTDVAIRTAKTSAKNRKLSDGDGLTLLITPGGSRRWQVRFRLHDKPRTYCAGPYPEIGLADAREIAREVRKQVREGRDPVLARQDAKTEAVGAAAQTFKVQAEDWIANRVRDAAWKPTYRAQVERRLLVEVYPHIGNRSVREVTTRSMAGTHDAPGWFRLLRDRSKTTARQVRQHMSEVFEHAAAQGLMEDADHDPARSLRALVRNVVHEPRAAATDLAHARAVLAAIEGSGASPMVLLAHRWLVLNAARSQEALAARWSQIIDLDGAEPWWVIAKDDMKKNREHVVPLCPAAVEVLRMARRLRPDDGDLIFSLKGNGRRLGLSTIRAVYDRVTLPVPHVPHGWRSSFNSLMFERHRADRVELDLMLSHKPKKADSPVSAVESIYNRALLLARRRELSAIWADLILADAPSCAALVGLPDSSAKLLAA